jgi:hypothetical protein
MPAAQPPSECDPTWLVCETFEGSSVGAAPGAPWETEIGENAVVQVVDDRAARGERSLHLRGGFHSGAWISTSQGFPPSGQLFYGRFFLWLSGIPQGGVHWDFIEARENGTCYDGGSCYRWGGMFGHIMANYFPGDRYKHDEAAIPQTGEWTCIEWAFDGLGDNMYLWFDGADAPVATVLDGQGSGERWVAPRFDDLRLGWQHHQEAPDVDLWIDDIAVATTRIGCSP